MIYEAISHVPLSKDAYALDEENIVIRLRVARDDMTSCRCFYGDRVGEPSVDKMIPVKMERAFFDDLYDYYEARIRSQFTRVCYFFELNSVDGDYAYYSECGLSIDLHENVTQYFQMPYIHRADIVRQPEWTKGLVIYHIFPDSFASDAGFISGAGQEIRLENDLISTSKLGGTLEGVRKNLDYLLSLHVNCIYFNPIFRARAYHKYDTIDYYNVDPCFGSNEEFANLVKECHKRGIYVILDGVFNHSGTGFFAFQDVLKNQEKSKYKDWYYRLDFPIEVKDNCSYETFAYVKQMPKLNTMNPEVEEYFCNVGRYWIREMGIDGWRLDVANEINHDFWRKFRLAVRSEKKDAILIGEIWEDSAVWLQGDQFDSTMNYSFYYNSKEFFAQKRIDADEFAERISHMYLRYSETVSNMQMNFLDTHDVPRFLTYCNGDVERLKLAVTFMMTYPGIPSVFYGDEYGVEGEKECEYRQPMPWGKADGMQDFFREIISLRREHTALQSGQFRIIEAEGDVISYERFDENETIRVTLNRETNQTDIEIKKMGL